MAPNRFYIFNDELKPWILDSEAELPWPDCRYFRKVLLAIDQATPHLGLQFVVTDRVDGLLPLTGDDVVVICIRDELCRMPAYAHSIRLLAKTYGVQRRPDFSRTVPGSPLQLGATAMQEGIVHARRLPAMVRSGMRTVVSGKRPAVVDVPLGTYLLEDLPFVRFEERRFDVSYAGSRLNKPEEAYRRVPTRKARSRHDLEALLRSVAADRREWRVGTHIINTFQEAPAHSTLYSALLMDSRVVLCPRGGSLETYRFFEALRSGSIPVTERLPPRDFYTGSPALSVRRWSELPALLDEVLADRARLEARHRAALAWWESRCSPEAVARRLLAALGEVGAENRSLDQADGDALR
ncbi:MAG: hypothetical protein M3198_01540 [Actinomycetota bacterium]|nr:hypothetical protein [Actinomycetota bacterium]